jgi:hypothetical protein
MNEIMSDKMIINLERKYSFVPGFYCQKQRLFNWFLSFLLSPFLPFFLRVYTRIIFLL